MKDYTRDMLQKLHEIYENLADFNYRFSRETYQYYKGKAEAVREIIALIRKAENDWF